MANKKAEKRRCVSRNSLNVPLQPGEKLTQCCKKGGVLADVAMREAGSREHG